MLRRKLHLQVKNLALNLMLRVRLNLNTNMVFFWGGNVQNRIVLIIILVNLPEESLSELQIMVVEIKNPNFLDVL